MNRATPRSMIAAFALALCHAVFSACPLAGQTGTGEPVTIDIEVLVLAGGEPVAGAFVAVDLDGSGTWDEHLGEPHGHTDHAGLTVFSDLVSIGDPGHGDGGEDGPAGRHPPRIVIGNFSGTVGSNVVGLDFVLPAGSDQATLGLYDLRGRLLAKVRGTGDLRLEVPVNLPDGVYFARLSAGPAAPAALRFTSAGLRTRSIRAHRLSANEDTAAGLIEAQTQKQPNNDGWEHPANVIVVHPEYAPAIKPVVLTPDLNSFVVNLAPHAGETLYPGGFDIVCGYTLSTASMTTADTLPHHATVFMGGRGSSRPPGRSRSRWASRRGARPFFQGLKGSMVGESECGVVNGSSDKSVVVPVDETCVYTTPSLEYDLRATSCTQTGPIPGSRGKPPHGSHQAARAPSVLRPLHEA